MKRKKDRSAKVTMIASLVVILLVGVCVFSLYSIKEPEFLKGIGLFFGKNDTTATGKHLTREDETPAAESEGLVVTGAMDQDGSYAAPVVWETEGGQAVVVLGQQATPEEERIAAEGQNVVPAAEQKETPAAEQKETPAAEQNETTTAQQETVIQEQTNVPAEEMKTVETETDKNVQDVSGTALNGTANNETAVLEVQTPEEISDVTETQETALMAADETYEEEAPVHQVVRDDTVAEEVVVDDGWRFNYETEEWYQIGASYEEPAELAQPIQPEAYYGNAVEENGEWRFDDETEEWYFVEYTDDTTDDTLADDTQVNNEPEAEGEVDDSQEEVGEWLFNEDTGEWYYALTGSTESTSSDNKKQKNEETGGWQFDQETGEWYYVESTGAAGGDEEESQDETEEESQEEDSQDEESKGAWLFNEETGEWYYDENATVGEDGEDEAAADDTEEDTDDSEDDDEETVEGEWVYDEETHEWIYVEGTAKKEDTEEEETTTESETETTAVTEEVVKEPSLGEQIVDYAMGYVGVTPYVWAGNSLTGGTDCSGFVHLIYDKYGVYCSHASLAYDGGEFGTVIGLDELQPGDIVVYGGGQHVAIYAGDGYVVHCSSPENGTVYWKMDYRSDASWGLRVLE